MFPGLNKRWLMEIRDASLPLKIKVFLWQVYNDKIQSAEQLWKRNWPGEIACKVCGLDARFVVWMKQRITSSLHVR
jgi:hypothetical protein